MNVRDLIPWNRGRGVTVRRSEDANPFLTLHGEMNRVFDDVFRGFDLAPFRFDRTLAWVVGAAVAFFAVDALANLTEWEEWANMALGIWAILAPWLLGFAEVAQAMYAHLFIGLIVTVLAAFDLWMAHNRPVSMA